MNIFKELWQLAKMLLANKPNDCKELEVVQMAHFPFKNYLAMTWCGKIITRYPDKIDKQTITHETIHLRQAQQYANWITFYTVYIWEWMKGKPLTKPYNSAYYTIPFEVEAYANEDNEQYIQKYNTNNLKTKYNLKDRKTLFEQYGTTQYRWKTYIKGL